MARHLCTLPEELLLIIMELLDPVGIQCLRRTSGLFLRLFSSPCFSHQHNKELGSHPQPSWMPYTPWARPNRAFEAEALTPRFVEYLERDARRNFCTKCRAVGNGLAGLHRARNLVDKSLHCVGCDEKHPLAYFSAAERQRDEKARICIGHEGYFRLCEHKVIDWKTVANAVRQLNAHPATGAIIITPLLECRAASHIPTNHGIAAEVYPRLELIYRRNYGFLLTATWSGHLPLSELVSSGRHYSVGDITDRLRLLRRGAAEYIAPQSGPGYLPEMRLFDPNRCGFLDHTGTPTGTGVPGAWSLPVPSGSNNQSCRMHPGSGCLLRRPNPTGGRTQDEHGNIAGSHVVRTWFGRMVLPYGLKLQAEACASGGGRCLEVSYLRDVLVADINDVECRKVTHSWCEALHPSSYNLAKDSENHGILWCYDETCANYYRFVERLVMRKCRRKAGVTVDWFRSYRGWRPTTEATNVRVDRVDNLAHGFKPPESKITNTLKSNTARGELKMPDKPDKPCIGDSSQRKTRRKCGGARRLLAKCWQLVRGRGLAHR
ncbi:hypothetical protein B0T25DRAFT_363488 [Lasiosphaeria hispida]|uniref:F-box domain-containing protein n=1 Tax=Lasiosphaeria hispida TaxID=260671 RepID=A0AAJ0H5Q3_9PEZI|nr:hypothetical protein B0T25DRAFT_363488 [Lasiosphaeria hispida]